MNKKKILFGGMIVLMGILFVSAIEILDNGDIILTEEEFMALTDGQIAQYMALSLTIQRAVNEGDSLGIYYNVVHIEPTHENNTYRVFAHETRTEVTHENINNCFAIYNLQQCVQYLVTNSQPSEFNLGNGNTLIVNPTYYTIIQIATEQYERVLEMRDEISQQNNINSLMGEIQP